MKKSFLILLILTLLRIAAVAEAQPKSIAKIGWLAEQVGSGREIFRKEFRELGHVESKNVAFEYRYGGNDLDRLTALADELVRLPVDLLMPNSTSPAIAAKKSTRHSPSFS